MFHPPETKPVIKTFTTGVLFNGRSTHTAGNAASSKGCLANKIPNGGCLRNPLRTVQNGTSYSDVISSSVSIFQTSRARLHRPLLQPQSGRSEAAEATGRMPLRIWIPALKSADSAD